MRHKKTFLLLAALLLTVFVALLCGSALAEEKALWPERGDTVKKDGKVKVDVSNTGDGYFMAAVQSKNSHKLKLQVVHGEDKLTYDLNSNGEYEVFPLQLGEGKYTITLYENVSGKKYSQEGKISISVTLKSEARPFLYPNQYVNYSKTTEAVLKAAELCDGKTDKEAFDIICNFMKTGFVYDYVKAVTIKAGVLPDIDGSYTKKMGVCQDLAAIMVCMLRTQGIPCKLMIGYADKQYHAWTTAIIDGEEIFYDPTAALNAISKVRDYSLERYY